MKTLHEKTETLTKTIVVYREEIADWKIKVDNLRQ